MKESSSEENLLLQEKPKGFSPPLPHLDSKISQRCSTCASLPDEASFHSFDEKTNGFYFSSRNPPSSFYSVVQSACIRSLSCEVTPNGEPVIFGTSDTKGIDEIWTLSYPFKLKDSDARGFLRSYSLLLLSEYTQMISAMDFITNAFKGIIESLQKTANKFYEEQISDPNFTPPLARKQFLRDISQLLHQPDLFSDLHYQFSWILHSMQSLFLHISFLAKKKKPHLGDIAQWNHFELMVNKLKNKHHGFFECLHQIHDALGPEIMRSLIHSALIGNQIIIRGDYQSVAISLLMRIQKLLPKKCVSKPCEFSNVYRDPWENTFLAIPEDIGIPSHVDPKSYFLLDIKKSIPKTENPSPSSAERNSKEESPSPRNQSEVKFYHLYDFSFRAPPFKAFQLGSDIEKILQSRETTCVMKQNQIKVLKQQWKSKTRLLVPISQKVVSETDPRFLTFLKCFKLNQTDLLVLKHWSLAVKLKPK